MIKPLDHDIYSLKQFKILFEVHYISKLQYRFLSEVLKVRKLDMMLDMKYPNIIMLISDK